VRLDVLTIFPGVFTDYLAASITGRAIRDGRLSVAVHDLRDYTDDRHRVTDDTPYGGGAGMVMKPEPIFRAVEKLRTRQSKVLLTSPQGRCLDQPWIRKRLKSKHLIVICGHYRGVDQRVVDMVDEEVSIGDYVLSGGELPALVLIDALARLQPGAVSDPDSLAGDSFNDEMLDYPHYTRPRVHQGEEVPEVLVSGDHRKIAAWRTARRKEATALKRPDLMLKRKGRPVDIDSEA
jgi:tRNA (guanine37-N1)-methyltransferase